MNNTKVCNLFKTNDFTIELHVFTDGNNNANEMRLYIMDSDNQYVDDWAYDIGEDISKMVDAIATMIDKGCERFVKFVGDAFDKQIYTDLSVREYQDMIIEYGREYVNRIGGCVLVTKE